MTMRRNKQTPNRRIEPYSTAGGTPKKRQPRMHRQRGAILVFGLVLLLAITMLGSSGIQNVMLEEKMNTNQINKQMAFHGADTVLLECENTIRDTSVISLVAADAIADLGDFDVESGDWWSDHGFWDNQTPSSAALQKTTANPSGLNSQPACSTEFIGSAGTSQNWDTQVAGTGFDATEKLYYRVTAFSTGRSNKSTSVLETIYAK